MPVNTDLSNGKFMCPVDGHEKGGLWMEGGKSMTNLSGPRQRKLRGNSKRLPSKLVGEK